MKPALTQYEKTSLLAERARALSFGSEPAPGVPEDLREYDTIARYEFHHRLINPTVVVRGKSYKLLDIL